MIATIFALCVIGVLTWVFWPQISDEFRYRVRAL